MDTIIFPDGLFTIDELHKLNPNFFNITLRVNLKKLINSGEVIEIGTICYGRGRPKNIHVKAPLTEKHFDLIKKSNIFLKNDLNITINSTKDTKTAQEQQYSIPKNVIIYSRDEIIKRANLLFL